MRAMWKGAILAESDEAIMFEGSVYFPKGSLNPKHMKPSQSQMMKQHGMARFYDVVVQGEENKDAAWWYPDPEPSAAVVKGLVAFFKGVKIA